MSIILDKVDYIYSEGTVYESQALKNINLKVEDGEFVGLAGHTGSGKSTLIQLFNGLRKPSSGGIYYNGADIHDTDYDRKALRSKVGLVFQYPEHQLFEKTIFDDVCFGPMNQGLSKNEAGLRAFEALKMVGLPEELYYQPPFSLSGGQKRCAAIAGVLAMKPEMLVLDEPAAGLDPGSKDELYALLVQMNQEQDMTVVLVSHSMEDMAQYVNRMVVLNEGQILYDDSVKNVFAHYKELEKIGLAAPQVTYFMHELKEAGFAVSTEPVTVDEALAELLNYFRVKKKS